MESSTTRNARDYVGGVVLLIGCLLIVGSIVWFVAGPETVEAAYEYVKSLKWALLCFLAGLGLVVVAFVLSPGLRQPGVSAPGMGPAPGTAPKGGVRCRQCQAPNDEHAKFCNQCGTAV
jgi:hypothetical protein